MLLGILQLLIIIAIVFEGIAALSSFVFYKKYKRTWLKIMPFFLTYTFLTEWAATYGYILPLNNNLVYNVIALITFNYYLLVYYYNLNFIKFKKTVLTGIAIYIFSFIASTYFQQISQESFIFSYSIGGIFIIIAVLFYFIEKLLTPEILNIKSDLLFWISIGFLIFYVGYIPIKITRQFYASTTDHYNYLKCVQLILVIIMNGVFSIGFFKSKWSQ